MALYGNMRRTAVVFKSGCPVVGQTAETLQPSFPSTMAIRAAQGHQLVFVSSTVGYKIFLAYFVEIWPRGVLYKL